MDDTLWHCVATLEMAWDMRLCGMGLWNGPKGPQGEVKVPRPHNCGPHLS